MLCLQKIQFATLREKKNIHLCLNPFISPEQERSSAQLRAGALRPDQILFRWEDDRRRTARRSTILG